MGIAARRELKTIITRVSLPAREPSVLLTRKEGFSKQKGKGEGDRRLDEGKGQLAIVHSIQTATLLKNVMPVLSWRAAFSCASTLLLGYDNRKKWRKRKLVHYADSVNEPM